MVEFLSDAWLDAMAAAAATVGRADDLSDADGPDAPLTLRQVVRNGPAGDVVYDLLFDDRGITVDRTGTATPDVTFEQDHETAAGLVRGDMHPHVALTGGQLVIAGAAHRLPEWRQSLDALDQALSDLRDRTTW